MILYSGIDEGTPFSHTISRTIPQSEVYHEITWDLNDFFDAGVVMTDVDKIQFQIPDAKNDGDIYFGPLNIGTIPEPNTVMLLLAAGGLMAVRRWRFEEGPGTDLEGSGEPEVVVSEDIFETECLY